MADKIVTRPDHVNARGRQRSDHWTVNKLPSKTVVSDAHEADIHRILRKYEAVGIVDHLNQTEAQYADVSEFTDYADLLRQVQAAEAEFKKLPSKMREVFEHDVGNYLDAAHDPDKREVYHAKMVEAGLIEVADKDSARGTPPVAGGEGGPPDVVAEGPAE